MSLSVLPLLPSPEGELLAGVGPLAPAQAAWHTAEDLVEVRSEPLVEPVVDDGVDAGVGHGQPVEAEVDVADVRVGGDGWIVVGVDEVDVIRSPAHHEYHDHHSEHLDDLLLVVPALGEGRLGHQQPEGGLVATPQVSPHLSAAFGRDL